MAPPSIPSGASASATAFARTGTAPMVRALPPLWKGLLYAGGSLEAAGSLLSGLSFDERVALHHDVARDGLRARLPRAGTVLDVARDLVALAAAGLANVAPGERGALAPVEEIVATGRMPSDRVRDAWRQHEGNVPALVAALAIS